jgi:hypothetical protein
MLVRKILECLCLISVPDELSVLKWSCLVHVRVHLEVGIIGFRIASAT